MKKLFIPLLITMTGLAVNSALAQSTATITKPGSSGFVTVDGQTGTELDATTTNSYLEDICGLFNVDGTWQYTNASGKYVAPKTAGDVFFVEVNDYWIGYNVDGYDFETQIKKGVKRITAVDANSSQKTSTGTFYTHPATDVNKFFFIVRRSNGSNPKDVATSNNLAFGWYDEWSYVTNTGVNGSKG